jgi:hypothetical protein
METIIRQMKQDGYEIDGALFCGDYSKRGNTWSRVKVELNNAGIAAIVEVLEAELGLGHEDAVFVQGNHDHVEPISQLPFINETGGYALGDAAMVYVLNFKDYNSEGQNPVTITNTAANLKNWLAQQTVGEKPIFVISHVPLHQSIRAYEKGDAQYAKYIVDVLNEAGARGLNIIFLYGHNHSDKNAGYMGGSTNFVARGESIWVPNTAGTTQAPTNVTINFTYMNAGFVRWYGNVKEESTDDLTMSVFEIREDDVTITRYSKDGEFPLQEKVGTFYNDAEAAYGYTVDATTQESGLVVRGGEIIYRDGE